MPYDAEAAISNPNKRGANPRHSQQINVIYVIITVNYYLQTRKICLQASELRSSCQESSPLSNAWFPITRMSTTTSATAWLVATSQSPEWDQKKNSTQQIKSFCKYRPIYGIKFTLHKFFWWIIKLAGTNRPRIISVFKAWRWDDAMVICLSKYFSYILIWLPGNPASPLPYLFSFR